MNEENKLWVAFFMLIFINEISNLQTKTLIRRHGSTAPSLYVRLHEWKLGHTGKSDSCRQANLQNKYRHPPNNTRDVELSHLTRLFRISKVNIIIRKITIIILRNAHNRLHADVLPNTLSTADIETDKHYCIQYEHK